ncbi:hypothetical protein HNR73_004227 [Phytomonospora endophytica]|uniref:Uncharacterized protein n=1 Tax=Phytomonospora endophytica TaxID=714109 RepID=A0A841FV25_9ACTN|nr:hypothetical protein [Phytomonospora endophytica]
MCGLLDRQVFQVSERDRRPLPFRQAEHRAEERQFLADRVPRVAAASFGQFVADAFPAEPGASSFVDQAVGDDATGVGVHAVAFRSVPGPVEADQGGLHDVFGQVPVTAADVRVPPEPVGSGGHVLAVFGFLIGIHVSSVRRW